MTFGKKLKHLRKQLGKTQVEVANEITEQNPHDPMSQARLSYLEGKTTAPRQDIIELFTKYYGVPVSYFFEQLDTQAWDTRKAKIKDYLNSLGNRKAYDTNSQLGTLETLDTLNMWMKSYNGCTDE